MKKMRFPSLAAIALTALSSPASSPSANAQTTQSPGSSGTGTIPYGAYYKEYRYTFSGTLNLLFSQAMNRSYQGSVVSSGAPDYKVKSFKLNVGGLSSGWVQSEYPTPNYWEWDLPKGSLRVHLSVATPFNDQEAPGRATVTVFGTFGGDDYSSSQKMIITPIGPPLFDDKMEGGNGSYVFTHYMRKTAPPADLKSLGVSLDELGVKPGMSVKEVEGILAPIYKSKASPGLDTISLDYKGSVLVTSAPFTTWLDYSKDNDTMRVGFGNPTTGNIVDDIVREINFPDGATAPTVSDVVSALKKKFGQPTKINGEYSFGGRWIWLFGKNGLIKSSANYRCPSNKTTHNYDYYSPPLSSERSQFSCVEAVVTSQLSDVSHAASVKLTVIDLADIRIADGQAMKQMHAAAVADYNRVHKVTKAPKL